MPQVNCPKCDRAIPLADSELALLIECAGCSARFYPMMPLDGPLSAHPKRDAEPAQSAAGESHPRTVTVAAEPIPDQNPPPPTWPKRPRRKKRKPDRTPLIVAVCVGLAMVVGFTLAGYVLVNIDTITGKPAAAQTAKDDSEAADESTESANAGAETEQDKSGGKLRRPPPLFKALKPPRRKK